MPLPAPPQGVWSGTCTSRTRSRAGEGALWAIYTHMLRELAQHGGHADILREEV